MFVSSNSDLSKNKNRRRMDIVKDVLAVASVRVRKTKIMYQANLSFVQLEKYLSALTSGGLVERGDDSMYLTTKKGRDFLETYSKYCKLCSKIRQEAEEAAKGRQMLENAFFNGRKNLEGNVGNEEALS